MPRISIITNNVPRPVINAYELTLAEREEFDYLSWEAIDRGEDSASFGRYKGQLYNLQEFENAKGYLDTPVNKWDGVQVDSFFSGILIRYTEDFESVIFGRYYS